MNQPQTVIVYQSKAEYEMEQFMQSNPEAVLIFFGILIVVVAIFVFKNRRSL